MQCNVCMYGRYGMVWFGIVCMYVLEWNGMDWTGLDWNGMEWNGCMAKSVLQGSMNMFAVLFPVRVRLPFKRVEAHRII